MPAVPAEPSQVGGAAGRRHPPTGARHRDGAAGASATTDTCTDGASAPTAAKAPAVPAAAAPPEPAAAKPSPEPEPKPATAPADKSESAEDQSSRQRPAAKKCAKGRRSSVPSWDEIMLGSSRQRD